MPTTISSLPLAVWGSLSDPINTTSTLRTTNNQEKNQNSWKSVTVNCLKLKWHALVQKERLLTMLVGNIAGAFCLARALFMPTNAQGTPKMSDHWYSTTHTPCELDKRKTHNLDKSSFLLVHLESNNTVYMHWRTHWQRHSARPFRRNNSTGVWNLKVKPTTKAMW